MIRRHSALAFSHIELLHLSLSVYGDFRWNFLYFNRHIETEVESRKHILSYFLWVSEYFAAVKLKWNALCDVSCLVSVSTPELLLMVRFFFSFGSVCNYSDRAISCRMHNGRCSVAVSDLRACGKLASVLQIEIVFDRTLWTHHTITFTSNNNCFHNFILHSGVAQAPVRPTISRPHSSCSRV